MDSKKQIELRCLDLTREYVISRPNNRTRKYINSLIPICDEHFVVDSSERPDFVAHFKDSSYLIEHFMIDICYDGPQNNQSQSRLFSHEVSGIFKRYHDPEIGTIRDESIGEATKEIEETANRILNIPLSFDYEKYVESFRRVFNHHYEQIDSYLLNKCIKNSDIKVGFMIELHCDTILMNATKNNSNVYFRGKKKEFPLTKEIVDMFESANKLDFIILSQFNEGVSIESSGVHVYEPRNMKKSLEVQGITVFDKVFYTKIRKKINLNIISSDESK